MRAIGRVGVSETSGADEWREAVAVAAAVCDDWRVRSGDA